MGKLHVHFLRLYSSLAKASLFVNSVKVSTLGKNGGDVDVQIDQDCLVEAKVGLLTCKFKVKADSYTVACIWQGPIGIKANVTSCSMSVIESGKRLQTKGKVIIACNKFYALSGGYKVFVDGEEIGTVSQNANQLEIQIERDCEIVIKERGLSVQKIVAQAKADEVKTIRIIPTKQTLLSSESILFKDGFKLSKPVDETEDQSKLKKVGKTLLKHKRAIMLGVGAIAAIAGLDADGADVDADDDIDVDDDFDADDGLDFDDDDVTFESVDTDGDGFDDTVLVDVDGDGLADAVGMDTDGDGLLDTYAVDTDGDGAFDTFGADVDGDGAVDTVAVDTDGDGTVDSFGVDTDGDGAVDTVGFDTDGDGSIDTMGVDTDGDGAVDTVGFDTNGDGSIDTMGFDTDGDGTVDIIGRDTDANGTIDTFTAVHEEETLTDRVASLVDDVASLSEADNGPVIAGVAAAAVAGTLNDKNQKQNVVSSQTESLAGSHNKKSLKWLWIVPLTLVAIGGIVAALMFLGNKNSEKKNDFIYSFFERYYDSYTDKAELFENTLSPELLSYSVENPELLGLMTESPSDVFGTLYLDYLGKGYYQVNSTVYDQVSSYIVHVNNKLKIDEIKEAQSVVIPSALQTTFYPMLVVGNALFAEGELILDIEPPRPNKQTRYLTGDVVLDGSEGEVSGEISRDEIKMQYTFDWLGTMRFSGSYDGDAIQASMSPGEGSSVEYKLFAFKDMTELESMKDKLLSESASVPSSERNALMSAATHALFNLPDHSSFDSVDNECYSNDFRAVLLKAFEKSATDYVEGEIGDDEFLAYWYEGNGDAIDLDSKVLSITSYNTENAAVKVDLSYIDFPEEKRTFLMSFKKEDGQWLLDDWLDSPLSKGMKSKCQDYIKE